jgi:hypothetical protein
MKSKRLRILALSIMITACGGKVLATNDGPTNDEPLVVGKACASDTDCSNDSDGSLLACAFSIYGEQLPNGYCSESCTTASDCSGPPAAVGCGQRAADIHNGYSPYCFAVCDPQGPATQCRSGYQCLPFTTPEGNGAFGCFIVSG